MNTRDDNSTHSNDRLAYDAPVIVYEGDITTRAGSPLGGGKSFEIDPTDLFGNSDS